MREAPRRNSVAMVLVVAVRLVAAAVGSLIVALAVQALVGTTASATVFVLVAAIIVVRLALVTVDWRTTTYVLGDDAIEYRIGRMSTSAQRIAYASIHGVRRDVPWLLRLLGRAELTIEHGAGDGLQLRFAALRDDAIDEIVSRVTAANPDVVDDLGTDRADAVPADDAVPTAPADDAPPLLRYAVARGRYLLAIPLALAGVGIVAQLTGTDYPAAFAIVGDCVRALSTAAQVVLGLGAVFATTVVGAAARFASIAGYRRTLTPATLETRQGLVGSSDRSLAHSDVTIVELRRPLAYRVLGRTMLFVSGGSGRGDPPLDLAPDVATIDEANAAAWATRVPAGPTVGARTRWSWTLRTVLVAGGVAWALLALAAPSMPGGSGASPSP